MGDGGMGCGHTCMAYTLVFINFIFFCIGATALGLGIWTLVDSKQLMELVQFADADPNMPSLFETGAIVMCAGGGAIILIAILGCCGACKHIKWCLGLYAGFVLLILLVELAAGVLAVIFRDKIEGEVSNYIKDKIRKEYDGKLDTDNAFTKAMDYTQVYFECCGYNNHSDLWESNVYQHELTEIPRTCCILENKQVFYEKPTDIIAKYPDTCPMMPSFVNSYWGEGCKDKVIDWVLSKTIIVVVIAFVLVVVEIICVIFACCLMAMHRKKVDS